MSVSNEHSAPVALVTGASRGLGETLAHFLAGQGYNLVLTARRTELLDTAAAGLGEAPSDERRAELATHRGIYLALAGDVAGARLCFHEALRADGGKEAARAALQLLGP